MMDRIQLPIRFNGLSERDLHDHIRHCAAKLMVGGCAEFLLSEAGAVIVLTRRRHRRKSDMLAFSLRGGSLGRGNIAELRTRLRQDGYKLAVYWTPKRRLLSRIVVLVPIDDALLSSKGVAVFRRVASQLGSPWPQAMSAGYLARMNTGGLPGELDIQDPGLRSSHDLGKQIGTGIARVLGLRR